MYKGKVVKIKYITQLLRTADPGTPVNVFMREK